MKKEIRKIPTWDNGTWTYTTFIDRAAYKSFLLTVFKEPGKYEFDETSFEFNAQKRLFRQQKDVFCLHASRTPDYNDYWDTEKEKCLMGAIYKNKGKTWYLPRDYYMWLNFLPIYDKAKKDFDFPDVRDVQMHIALYEELAEMNYKHASILKKRQIASSYFHMAKFINRIWFDKGVILKMGASLKDYIGMEGSWKFLEEYKAFLNGNTAWYRPMNPGKTLLWQQKIEFKQGNRKKEVGLKGTIQGMSFEQSDTKGVGGPCTIFFYEEAGIAKKMDKTFEFLRPALEDGDVTTGLFIAAGSVGKLTDAMVLKDFTNYPQDNDMYAVETDLIDEKGTRGMRGLFIPEQWSMLPYIDEFGNSLVVEALTALESKFEEWKKKLDPARYQLRVSQHPRNIKEAFASREISTFPLHLVEHQELDIKDNMYPYDIVKIDKDHNDKYIIKKTTKPPISDFPIKKNLVDKTGAIVMWEKPDKTISFGTYIASIDPVGVGKTTTSDSLVSIYIYKTATQVKRYTEDGVDNFVEGDKIVCSWCGRFDDINDTHHMLLSIIVVYNAWTLVENNISNFIQFMIKEKKQQYLVKKSEMLFLKEVQSNKASFQDYGWRNTGRLFYDHLLPYLVNWLKEVVEEDMDDDGVVTKKYYGIRRLPDLMALKEMQAYQEGLNVDRLISLGALIAFVKIRESNSNKPIKVENEIGNNLENSQNLYKLKHSPFRTIGKNRASSGMGSARSPFKRIGK